jgi:hypothetical protein
MTSGTRDGRKWLGLIFGVIGVLTVGIGVYRLFFSGGPGFTIPRMSGGALVLAKSDRPTAFVLASHWEETWRSGTGRGTWVRGDGILHWDVFAFETGTLTRRFVSRISSIRRGGRNGYEAILGIHEGVVWVLADSLVAMSEADGRILGDVKTLEAKEPRLNGMIPSDAKRFAFDRGLIVTAADATKWRIVGPDLAASQVSEKVTPESTNVTWLPNGDMPPYQSLKKRSVVIGGVWYGLGAPDEIDKFTGVAEWTQDFREPRRYALWSGLADKRAGITRTPSSAEYLQGGLLIHETVGEDYVIGIPDPVRVLVLHQDRVDTRAKQSLSCVHIDGKQCWTAALGVSSIRNAVPLSSDPSALALLLFAVDYAVDEKGDFVDGGRDASDQILRVSMTDGAVARVDFGTMDMAEVKANAIKPPQ